MTQVAQSTRKINPGRPTRRPISAKLLFLKRVGTKAVVINKKGARNQSPRIFTLLRTSFISNIVTIVTHSTSIKRSILSKLNLSLPSIKTNYPTQNKASGNGTCQMQSLVYYTMYCLLCYIIFRLRASLALSLCAIILSIVNCRLYNHHFISNERSILC
jgi:hypothetical protein